MIKRNKEFTVKKSSQDTLVALVPLVGSSWGPPRAGTTGMDR